MKAMILAAGRGERMRPLTDHRPKPLLEVGGKALLDWHLQALAAAGFREVVINASYLAEQIVAFCGAGSRWSLQLHYSVESRALETAGGIVQALPLLGEGPFLVVNGDVWTDYDFSRLRQLSTVLENGAHLVMVDNPDHHGSGDFSLDSRGALQRNSGTDALTYAGVGVYSPGFFAGFDASKMPLRPLLEQAIDNAALSGERFRGRWCDVGTPERLALLSAEL